MALKLTHLRDVVAAAEQGSLRAAARHLGVTQPAISRSIREVEKELGVALFERSQQGIRLTGIGERFLLRARSVQSELRRAREEIDQLKGELHGQVSVAMSAVSTFIMMPSAVRNFRAEFPKAVLNFTEGFFQDLEPRLLSGEIDFYVGPYLAPSARSRFNDEKLYDNARVVIARRGHPLSGVKTLSGLIDADWVKPTLAKRASEADFELPFEKNGFPAPNVVIHTTSATATLLAVANSDLLTIVPRNLLRPPISADLFDVIEVDRPISAPPICLVRRADMPLTPLAERLCDLIRRAGVKFARGDDRTLTIAKG